MKPTDPIPTIIVIIGTVAGFILALSPLPLVYKVYRSKELGFYRPDPFIAGLVFGIANGTYSLFSNQLISFISTAITFTLYSIYLLVFIYFAGSSRRRIIVKAGIAILIGATITGIGPIIFLIIDGTSDGEAWLEERGGVESFIRTWLGVCATISIMLLLSGQLSGMVKVIRTKDARSISTLMMIGGLMCSITWTVYASLIVDPYYITANAVGVMSGLTLLILKLKYRDGSSSTPLEEKRVTELGERIETNVY